MCNLIKAYASAGIMMISLPYIIMRLIVERQSDPGYPQALHPDLDWSKINNTIGAVLEKHSDAQRN